MAKAAAAAAAVLVLGVVSPAARAATPSGDIRLCPPVAKPGVMSCLSTVHRSRTPGVRPLIVNGFAEPADLRAAYGLPSVSAGTRRTVAIVDAFDDPKAEADLAVYRSHYGIPACTTANGCFRKLDQNGGTGYPAEDDGWAGEISLDLDMVSAVCPNCRILLVEAKSNDLSDLGTGVNTAAGLGAGYISNSYGGAEFVGETAMDTTYFSHPGKVVTASTGDDGYGVLFPAASPSVTAVGGTTLAKAPGTRRGWSETAWSGAGSGCSAYEAKPSWQHDTGCANRTVADVSAVADPGVAVYDSIPFQGAHGWIGVGGTSVSSPIIAATYALAGSPGSSTTPADYPYAHPGALTDITSGSNGTCGTYLCTAGTGYDGPTGLGTPVGTTSLSEAGALTGPVASGVFAKCLDGRAGDHAGIWNCDGSASQSWEIAATGAVSVNGKCLGVNGTANGTRAALLTCDGTASQEWRPAGTGELMNPHSGRCLDDPGFNATNGTPLDSWDCAGSANERWTPPSAVPTSSGPVASRVKSTVCVDAGTAANGIPAKIWTCNGTAPQKATISDDGTIQIKGKCLDIKGYGTANGTTVDLWSCVGQTNQQWRVLSNGAVLNPESGRCLDDPGFSVKNGTRLDIWDCVGSANELWKLP